jgi:hypothetical protein
MTTDTQSLIQQMITFGQGHITPPRACYMLSRLLKCILVAEILVHGTICVWLNRKLACLLL